MTADEHLTINWRNWESRVPLHQQGYDLDAGPTRRGGGEYALREAPERLAATYTLRATRAA